MFTPVGNVFSHVLKLSIMITYHTLKQQGSYVLTPVGSVFSHVRKLGIMQSITH